MSVGAYVFLVLVAVTVGLALGTAGGWLVAVHRGERPGEHRRIAAREDVRQRLGAGGYVGGELPEIDVLPGRTEALMPLDRPAPGDPHD